MKTKEVIAKLYEDHRLLIRKSALVFYDQKGVVTPHRVPPNNSREYSHKNYMDLSLCCLLSDVGVPLELIKRLLVENDISAWKEVKCIIHDKRYNNYQAGESLKTKLTKGENRASKGRK